MVALHTKTVLCAKIVTLHQRSRLQTKVGFFSKPHLAHNFVVNSSIVVKLAMVVSHIKTMCHVQQL